MGCFGGHVKVSTALKGYGLGQKTLVLESNLDMCACMPPTERYGMFQCPLARVQLLVDIITSNAKHITETK